MVHFLTEQLVCDSRQALMSDRKTASSGSRSQETGICSSRGFRNWRRKAGCKRDSHKVTFIGSARDSAYSIVRLDRGKLADRDRQFYRSGGGGSGIRI
jgi:hypothetical protein